jgi:hypothetical protein
MSFTHTPGPWSVEAHGKGLGLYSGRDSNHHGLRLLNIEDGNQNLRANINLIVAAPDLLAACKAVLQDVGDFDMYPPNARGRNKQAFEMIVEAVAKATAGDT